MKVLYGIQGTGNGHITRARAMAVELQKAGIDVQYLVSGRPQDKLFDMAVFGDYLHREGLTFVVKDGQISTLSTLLNASPIRFIKDIRSLDVSQYDLIITDYEPVTAWAGLLSKTPVIGLGHQYAFRHPIPCHKGAFPDRLLMRYFAPATKTLGLHWHHFEQPILPPIAPVKGTGLYYEKGLIITYLPFESVDAILRLLRNFDAYHFAVYHPDAPTESDQTLSTCPHISWHKPNREGFQEALHRCEGVICNSGFELASETLQLGKKILVKPVSGQPEQFSNALALELLGYGHTMYSLDGNKVGEWLTSALGTRIRYPNVAEAICQWISAGSDEPISDLADRLWQQTELPDLTALTRKQTDFHAEPNRPPHRKVSHG